MINVGANEGEKSFRKFIGFASMKVVAINPSRQELESLLGRELQRDTEYISMRENIECSRIDFWLKPVDENSPIPLIKYTAFLKRQAMKSQAGKNKVIDRYGNTAWVTDEEFKNQAVPKSAAGKSLGIIPPYELCCDGQDVLVDFLRPWLNIPNALRYDAAVGFVPKDKAELEKSECHLDNFKNYWKGDISEIKNLLSLAKDHVVKVLLTVKSKTINDKPANVQSVFGMVVAGWRDFASLEKEFRRQQERGGLSNIVTWFGNAKEYVDPVIEQMKAAAETAQDDNPWAVQPAQEVSSRPNLQGSVDDLPF